MVREKWRQDPRLQALTPEQRALLESRLEEKRKAAVGTIPRRADPATAPLTLDQQFLWFISELSPETSAYNINYATHLTGDLDRPVLGMPDLSKLLESTLEGAARNALEKGIQDLLKKIRIRK